MKFSDFNEILTSNSKDPSKSSGSSNISYVSVFNPRLFKKIGGIDGLNEVFKMFFQEALKDKRLS